MKEFTVIKIVKAESMADAIKNEKNAEIDECFLIDKEDKVNTIGFKI